MAGGEPHKTGAQLAALHCDRDAEMDRARDRVSDSRIDELIVSMLAARGDGALARGRIEMDNAVARIRFIDTVPCLRMSELAEAGLQPARLLGERACFAVPFQGEDRFPAFQFLDGEARPAIGRALRMLPNGMTPWQIGFWFVSSNPWLDGLAPADRLDDVPAVVEAARMESEALPG